MGRTLHRIRRCEPFRARPGCHDRSAQDRLVDGDTTHRLPRAADGTLDDLGQPQPDELLARQITQYTIFEPQWWSTCCGQGVTPHARNAGGARVPVQVLDAQGQPWSYVFDVFVDGTVYFGDAEGNPYRHWLLRDAYPHGEPPLYWTLVYTGSVHAP